MAQWTFSYQVHSVSIGVHSVILLGLPRDIWFSVALRKTTYVHLVKCRPYHSFLHHCRPHSPFLHRTRRSWADTGSRLYTGGHSHSLPLNTAVHPIGPDTGARRHTPAPGRCTSSRGRTETGLLEQSTAIYQVILQVCSSHNVVDKLWVQKSDVKRHLPNEWL